MSVNAVNGGGSGLFTDAAAQSSGQSQESQFLELLITQIQNQNPLDPLDNAEFTSQLTQLSSLDQLESINSSLEENLAYSRSLNNTLMLGLVGRNATVSGQTLNVAQGEASANKLQVDGNGTASVRVLDADGRQVAAYTESVVSGLNDISWDGRLADGGAADDGTYTLEVEVNDAQGDAVSFAAYMEGLIASVRFENNLAVFNVNGGEYYASEILEIGI